MFLDSFQFFMTWTNNTGENINQIIHHKNDSKNKSISINKDQTNINKYHKIIRIQLIYIFLNIK